jgi:hypothetical protein
MSDVMACDLVSFKFRGSSFESQLTRNSKLETDEGTTATKR